MIAEPEPLLLGSSDVLEQLRADVRAAARSGARVLIEGETGVGKDVAARLIHSLSRRRSQRFVAVNCAGLPDSLLESELFGHVRGSFTGAYRDKVGLAALADRGTLFLDEVGEMSPRMQAVLLRFTEQGEINPVGSDRTARTIDVRLIAATNRSLSQRVSSGDFRSDLYYRLNVVHLEVPPLRVRGADIMLLFRHFVDEFTRSHQTKAPVFTDAALETLLQYEWPGNVRELRNLAEQLVVKEADRPIDLADLPRHLCGVTPPAVAAGGHPGARPLSQPASDGPAESAWNRIVRDGLTFWTAVYGPFMDHELTKADVRIIVKRGLRESGGSYRRVTELFRMSSRDYRRFLAFLHQYDCHVAAGPAPMPSPDTARTETGSG
jgi:transcriptional regulator with GAF, ATPase, and Fis domain